MHKPPEIKDFKEFLEKNIKCIKVLDYSTKYLTALGDNYGSTMLAVTVQTQKSDDEKPSQLEVVAKMSPTNIQLQEIFQTEITFIKENAIYTEICPTLRKLQEDMNVPECDIYNVLPICYGARISLDENAKQVDSDALLVLENLKIRGYKTGDRFKGFNAAHCYVILKNLAKFNATPIALKLLRPNLFETKVKPYLQRIDIDAGMDLFTRNKMMEILHQELDILSEFSHLNERLKSQIEKCVQWQSNINECPTETIYTTAIHNDFWVNNMMIGYDSNGQPNDMKLIDFQLTMYESFVHDLIFFLLTSVEDEIREQKFDDFIKYYYDEFYRVLKQTGCPLEEFTYEKFLNEINRRAPWELFHVISMLKVVLARSDSMPEKHDEYSNDIFLNDNLVGPEYFVKLKSILREFEKRTWIW